MKIRKTICSLLLVCLAFLGIFCGRANVYADQKQALSATVTLLKQEKDCVVQVEAKNSGADFTGKVRLVFSGTDNSNGCAFEQRLTLPQNGKKQRTPQPTQPGMTMGPAPHRAKYFLVSQQDRKSVV